MKKLHIYKLAWQRKVRKACTHTNTRTSSRNFEQWRWSQCCQSPWQRGVVCSRWQPRSAAASLASRRPAEAPSPSLPLMFRPSEQHHDLSKASTTTQHQPKNNNTTVISPNRHFIPSCFHLVYMPTAFLHSSVFVVIYIPHRLLLSVCTIKSLVFCIFSSVHKSIWKWSISVLSNVLKGFGS